MHRADALAFHRPPLARLLTLLARRSAFPRVPLGLWDWFHEDRVFHKDCSTKPSREPKPKNGESTFSMDVGLVPFWPIRLIAHGFIRCRNRKTAGMDVGW
jgi:hypothetical protein